ncbi:MAG: TonB-dependent receptor [Lewinellaceae bacterium]|nr:TonB-dependent receptor [Saprospiraceae bacterium]MCB9341019.1 TonB-dependent receptor [Lewinellaceae bacterium]
MRSLTLSLSLLFVSVFAFGQDAKFTLSGHVRDAGSGEELIGANVFDPASGVGATTNLYGFYSLTLPAGNYQIEFSYLGYDTKTVEVKLTENKTLEVEVEEASVAIQEVVVSAERADRNVESVSMSKEKMAIEKIKTIPVVFGEVDLIKAIQLLPGVQTVGEGQSGFFVRGGGSDQNIILLDEAPVYNASHLLGFFSVFNADAIKDVQLYKGGIPASYGGRLSSVLDVRMKDGNAKKLSASGGIGTISSRLTVEAPIVKDKASFIVSGRRTYVDAFIPLFSSDTTLDGTKLYFYDLNLKANYRLGEKDRLFLSGYFGRDVFGSQDFRIEWGNGTGTLRWNHIFSSKLFSNITLIYSDFDYFLGSSDDVEGFKWDSKIKDYSLKFDFNYYLNPRNSIKFGYQVTRHKFQPGFARGTGDESIFNSYRLQTTNSLEHGLYVENEQELTPVLSAVYGLRLSLFQNYGAATVYQYNDEFAVVDSTHYGSGELYKTYVNLEPRVGLRLKLDDNKSVKASYNRMVQYMQLASNSQSSTPFDVWFPSSPNVKPQIADQVAVGYFQNFQNNMYEASVEVYYKKSQNAIDFKDYADLFLNKYLEGELRFGEARAYGAEFMVKKTKGRLTGWLAYTLAKSERKIKEINNGDWYSTNYDKTHDISLVTSYELNKRSTISLNFVYGTGAPTTFPTGRFVYNGEVLPVYSDRNAARMPDFHRMDISYVLRSKEKPGRKFFWDLNFSIYNLYNRHNPYTITFKEDEDKPGSTYAEKTYLFPILPSVTWNFNF